MKCPNSERGQSSVGNDVEEITRTEFRRSEGYNLIRIEESEEDIDPMFLNCMRALNARNSAAVRRPQQEHGPVLTIHGFSSILIPIFYTIASVDLL
ncbi:hypothetical protein Bca52824_019437 [Brassica carinata]|uniref:Uncharacterized protein n=1 Tax=Brassica carinata TaxID=52824 RepID=A0A8X8AYJ6_BRACI|nr:hypothetical protein Bca52824_019437 [Brassica carinata]